MLDTLEYLRRSGRVSWARASLGSLLRIKPFIEVKDGSVCRLGEVRTRAKGAARLVERIQESGPYERLAFLHTNAEDEARRLREQLGSQFSGTSFIINVTTIIGTHAGPGALGFAGLPR
jgi:DegV family protein with EDD domain